MKHLIISILCMMTIISCAKPNTIVVVPEPINTCVTPPKTSKIFLEDLIYVVVTDEYGIIYVATTPRDYEKLSKNMSKIIQNMKEKNAIIEYYEKCNADKEEVSNVGTTKEEG